MRVFMWKLLKMNKKKIHLLSIKKNRQATNTLALSLLSMFSINYWYTNGIRAITHTWTHTKISYIYLSYPSQHMGNIAVRQGEVGTYFVWVNLYLFHIVFERGCSKKFNVKLSSSVVYFGITCQWNIMYFWYFCLILQVSVFLLVYVLC